MYGNGVKTCMVNTPFRSQIIQRVRLLATTTLTVEAVGSMMLDFVGSRFGTTIRLLTVATTSVFASPFSSILFEQ